MCYLFCFTLFSFEDDLDDDVDDEPLDEPIESQQVMDRYSVIKSNHDY